jgi:hypothetical protein
MVPAHTPVVFALSAAEVSVAIASSTNHTAAGSGIHAQEDRATPNGASHVVGCRVVDVTTQEGEQEVVEMLTCADLLHGKQKCTVVRGRLPVDPAIMTGRQVDLEDAWMRNNWTTFKATGVEKHERKRVNCAWDYTGQMEMEFYPKGTRTATIKRGDSEQAHHGYDWPRQGGCRGCHFMWVDDQRLQHLGGRQFLEGQSQQRQRQ